MNQPSIVPVLHAKPGHLTFRSTVGYLTLVFAAALVINANAQTPVPKLIDRSRTGLVAYFKEVVANQKVIVGQQCSETPDVAGDYRKYFQSLFEATGKYPALLGFEYGYFANVDLAATNRHAIDHWKKGGLVTISWHADNPFKAGNSVRAKSVQEKDSIQLRKLLKDAPDSEEKRAYRSELGRVAAALKALKEAGVVVLWRPFHEMNGSWFWWGVNDQRSPTNQPEFEALWKDLHETLTDDFGLDNLLWVYSPNSPRGNASVSSMYPGDAYVDLVGVDNYAAKPEFAEYDSAKALGKIVVNGEIGPSKQAYGNFDQMEVLNSFKGKAAYFLQWHSWKNAMVAIVDNPHAKEMMNDEAAITLDEMR